MKSIKYSFAALTLLLSLFSCQRAEVGTPQKGNEVYENDRVYFTFKADLRAEENSKDVKLAALANEKKINTVDIVVFEGTTVHSVIRSADVTWTNGADKSQGGSIKLPRGKEYYLQFIANADASLFSDPDGIKTGMTEDNFTNKLIKKALPENGNQDFMMLGVKKEHANFTGTTPYVLLGQVSLRRLVARVDVYNLIPKLKMTKITINKRQKQSFLVARSSTNEAPTAAGTEEVDKVFDQAGNATWFTAGEAIAGIYTYEMDKSKEFTLTIEGQYNGKAVKFAVPFKNKGNTENLPIERNHLYRVIINTKGLPDKPEENNPFKFEIEVVDWEKGPAFAYEENQLNQICVSTPLAYMAEYDIKADDTWDKDIDNFAPDYLKELIWDKITGNGGQPAKEYYETGKVIDGKRYFLPTQKEWLSIIPGDGTSIIDQNRPKDTKLPLGSATEVEFGGRTYTMTGGLYNMGNKELYGAYIYTPKPEDGTHLYVIASYDLNTSNFVASKGKLEIKMAKVDKSTFDELTNGDFSTNANAIKAKFAALPVDAVVSRVLRAAGYWNGGSFNRQGTYGYYWSATPRDGSHAWFIYFRSGYAYVNSMSRTHGASVRLFARD